MSVVLHAAILGLGVAAVAIPIAIHLLVKRKKPPMPWGAMRFVQMAVKQTRRRMMLERWLLLACRCLLVLAAGIALARPLWSGGAGGAAGTGQTVYVVIDNSLASGAVDAAGVSDLRKSVAAARVMLESLGPGDQAAVIAASRPATGVIVPASGIIASVLEVLDRLEPTSSSLDVRGALTIAAREMERAGASGLEGAGAERTSSGLAVVHLISQWRGVSRSLREAETSVFATDAGGDGAAAATRRAALVIHPPATDATLSTTGIASVRLQRPLVIAAGADGASIEGAGPGEAGNDAGDAATRGEGTSTSEPTAIVTIDLVRSGAAVNEEQTTDVLLEVLPVVGVEPGAAREASNSTPSGRQTGTRVKVTFAAGQRKASAIAAIAIRTAAGGSAGARGGGFVLQAMVQGTTVRSGAARDSLAGDNTLVRGLVMKPAIRIGILADERAWSPSARQAWRLGTVSSDRVDAFTPGHWLSLALQPGLADQSLLRSTSGPIGGLQIVDLEQGPLDTRLLAGLDAVMVLSPELLGGAGGGGGAVGSAGGWGSLREFVDLGGVAIVMPPAGDRTTAGGGLPVEPQAWTEGMISAFALDWAFAGVREPPQRDGQGNQDERSRWPLVVGGGQAAGDGIGGRGAGGASAGSERIGAENVPSSEPLSRSTSAGDGVEAALGGGDLLAAIRGELPELTAAVSFDKLLSPQRKDQAGGAGEAGVTETQVYLSSSEGQGVLLAAKPKPEGGMLIYLATALDLGWTDLVAKPLMVPLMQELVRQGVGLSVSSAGISGSQGQVTASITAGQRPALRQGLKITSAINAGEPLVKAGVYPVEDDTGRLRGAVTVHAAVSEQLLDVAEPASVLRYGQQLFGRGQETGATGTGVVMVADATSTRVREALRASAAGGTGDRGGASSAVDGLESEQRASSSIWLGLALIAALVEIVFARSSSITSRSGGQP